MKNNNWHVCPVNDKLEHNTKSTKCICHPRIVRETNGNIIVHNSFDCREVKENKKLVN